MISKSTITIAIFTILLSCRLRHEDTFKDDIFRVHDFDETVIDFYFPDTIISPQNYENTYYKICFLSPTDLEKYFTFLTENDYQQCEAIINPLRSNSEDKGFANLLKARMHIHYFENDIRLKSKLSQTEINRYNDVYYLIQSAGNFNIETGLVNKLFDRIKPFVMKISLAFHEEMSISEKQNTIVNILRLKFRNKNMEDLSNQYIINYLRLTGIDSVDYKRLEGFSGFDFTGRPIFIRDIPFH